MLSKKERYLLQLLEDRASSHDTEIVTLEITGAKKSPLIRVYIDTPDGVSFNELTQAQDWIGEIIEQEDPFPGAYTLEVSSPGVDRPLRTAEHFKRFINEEVKVRTIDPIDGSSNFKGKLIFADDDEVSIDVDGKEIVIAHENISKANLIGKIEF